MSKVLHVDLSGAMTAPGTLVRPAGSYKTAVNCVIETPGVLRKRPGFNTTATATSNTQIPVGYVHTVRAITDRYAVISRNGATQPTDLAQADLITLYKKQKSSATGLVVTPLMDPQNYPTAIETYRPADSQFPIGRQSAATLGQSSFFTTGLGVQKIDFESTGTIIRRPAGIPKALPLDVFLTPVLTYSATGWFSDGMAYAFRLVWFYEKQDQTRIYGSPTGRVVHFNSSASPSADYTVQYTVQVPGGLNAFNRVLTGAGTTTLGKYGVRLYRSRGANLRDNGTWPSDELFLVNEAYLTLDGGGLPVAPTINVTTPDDDVFLGPPLYTNGSQEGLFRANDPPENFVFLEEWRNRLWGANYYTRHSLELTMFSLPSINDTITIDSTVLTFGATTAGFVVYLWGSSGEPGGIAAQQFFTMQALASKINEACQNVYAYVTSTPGGQTLTTAGATIVIEHREFTSYSTGKSFQVTFGSETTAKRFRPFNPDSGSFQLNSKGVIVKNTVLCSKYGQPDAFPPDDRTAFQLGDNNLEILGMSALEEGLYVFTTAGLYLISGRSESSFTPDLIDETVRLIGPECHAKCDGALWAWTTQGFAKIKNGRVEYVSGAIKDQLDKYVESIYQKSATIGPLSTLQKSSYTFCASHSQKNRVYLFLPNLSSFT